jgi:ribonuclease P/MRP protein subunit RPP20
MDEPERDDNMEIEEDDDVTWGWEFPEIHDVDPTKYRMVKRPPIRSFGKKNEIYVSTQTNFVVASKRVSKILDKDPEAEVVIHGLGAAINLAVDLALSIVKRSLGDLVASPTTTTEPLIDDFEPLSPELPVFTQVRYNSAIHIKISKAKRKKKDKPQTK